MYSGHFSKAKVPTGGHNGILPGYAARFLQVTSTAAARLADDSKPLDS